MILFHSLLVRYIRFPVDYWLLSDYTVITLDNILDWMEWSPQKHAGSRLNVIKMDNFENQQEVVI